MFKVALISMPWAKVNPSIQLATLKGYLESQTSNIKVRNYHCYLNVADLLGYFRYMDIAASKWCGNAIYAALLYPGKTAEINHFIKEILKIRGLELPPILSDIEESHDNFLSSIDWSAYNLVGFSVCHNQLLASLYLIKKLKAIKPDMPIVIGGAECAHELGTSLLNCFPEINFVVNGEGERPLLRLCQYLHQNGNKYLKQFISGVSCRDESGVIIKSGVDQFKDLNKLPTPDFKDFFFELQKAKNLKELLVRLPIEISRGCWWNQCAFCNLNLQWAGYRSKPPKKVIKK